MGWLPLQISEKGHSVPLVECETYFAIYDRSMGIVRFWRTWVHCLTFLNVCIWPWNLSSWICLHVIFQYLNNNILENSSLLDCDVLSSDVWFLIFKWIIVSSVQDQAVLDFEDEGNIVLSEIRHWTPHDTASCHRCLGFPATQLWEPHISQEYSNVKWENLPLCTCYSPNKCPCLTWLPVDMCKVSCLGLK